MDAPLVELRQVSKRYPTTAGSAVGLLPLSAQVRSGAFVVILGRSGSGKTTLLNLMAGLDTPTQGQVWVNGRQMDALSEDERAAWRAKHIGFVFQFFQLLPALTILENVMLPMELSHCLPRLPQRRARAADLLAQVGLVGRSDDFPASLSGGEQQRAAVARALANQPRLLLADEPTGNLDAAAAEQVLTLLSGLSRQGVTVILATHAREYASRASQVLDLSSISERSETHARPC